MMLSTTLILPFFLPAAHAQLNSLAVAAGLKYFGSATDNHELDDAPYVAILSDTTEFSMITVGNAQKWDTIGKTQDAFSFENADQIANLVAANGQTLRCHTLVWYNQLPSWVSQGSWTRETLQKVMVDHITGVVTQYKGQCYAWDVVNEAFDDTDAAAHRDSPFYKAMGEDYIKIAFEAARAADPDTKLYYNDYNIEYDGPKQKAALALITQMVNEGTPIDGVGAQGHYISGGMPGTDNLVANYEKYAALGLEVAITELDIRIELPATPAKLEQQALDYAEATKSCLDVPACIGITIWDYTDKYSWVEATFPGFGQALLWDADLKKKPAYDAVAEVLTSRAKTGTTPDPTKPDPTEPDTKPTETPSFTTSYLSTPTTPPTYGYPPAYPHPAGDLPVETKENKKETPTKENETETPTKDSEKETPTKESEKETPSKENEKENPSKENEKENPSKENEKENPSKENEKENPSKENEKENPSKENEKENPSKENEKENPSKENEKANPSKENEKENPSKENETETPSKENEKANPSKENEKENPSKEGEEDACQ